MVLKPKSRLKVNELLIKIRFYWNSFAIDPHVPESLKSYVFVHL